MESVLEQPVAALPASCMLDHTSLHLLPCGIQHDGKANIPGFFFLVDGQYPSSSSLGSSLSGPSASQEVTSLEVLSAAHTVTTSETTTEQGISSSPSTSTTTETTTTVTTMSASTEIVTTKPTTPETSFRGRTLKGVVIPVPKGYIGTIYKSYEHPAHSHNDHNNGRSKGMDVDGNEDEEYEAMLRGMQEERRTLRTKEQFQEFMMWGHDEQPTLRTEKVVRAMQWFDIANVLHEPLF